MSFKQCLAIGSWQAAILFVKTVSAASKMSRNHPVNINIEVSDNGEPTICVSGRDEAIITDREMEAFGMTQENLINATEEHFGNRPKQVFVKDPTPWGNTYEKYNWEPVRRIIIPRVSHPVVIGQTESEVFASQVFRNNTPNDVKQSISLTHQVEERITTRWSHSKKFNMSQDIHYDISFIGNGVSGTSGLSATGSWGKELSKAKTVTLGVTSSAEINMKPHQHIRCTLRARRCNLDVVVNYDVTLRGDIFENHDPRVKNHHFWAHDVNELLESGDMPTTIVVKQCISAGFYTDVELIAEDVTHEDNTFLRSWPPRHPFYG